MWKGIALSFMSFTIAILGACAFMVCFPYNDQITIDIDGITYFTDGEKISLRTVSYEGKGCYQATGYGVCKRCGWHLDQDYKCIVESCPAFQKKRESG